MNHDESPTMDHYFQSTTANADLLKRLFPNQPLFHPDLPSLAEVIRQETLNLNVGPSHNTEGSPTNRNECVTENGTNDDVVIQSLIRRLRSMEPCYQVLVPRFFQLPLPQHHADPEECLSMDQLIDRCRQFYDENQIIVPAVAHAFASQNYNILGPMVDLSHEQSVTLLQNTVPETAWLPRYARGLEHTTTTNTKQQSSCSLERPSSSSSPQLEEEPRVVALAASCFGAGFGGSCWALVPTDKAVTFCHQWKHAYACQFPIDPNNYTNLPREFFVMRPGKGAFSFG